MVSLNVDYTVNQMTIEFSKTKSNALNNVYSYFKDIINDYSVEIWKETRGGDFDLERIDHIVSNLKSVSDRLKDLLDSIQTCDGLLDLIGILNEEFHGDDALVFFMIFDVPTCVED
jgi:hypothetical protein